MSWRTHRVLDPCYRHWDKAVCLCGQNEQRACSDAVPVQGNSQVQHSYQIWEPRNTLGYGVYRRKEQQHQLRNIQTTQSHSKVMALTQYMTRRLILTENQCFFFFLHWIAGGFFIAIKKGYKTLWNNNTVFNLAETNDWGLCTRTGNIKWNGENEKEFKPLFILYNQWDPHNYNHRDSGLLSVNCCSAVTKQMIW